jgi:hypothetical protein
MPGLRPVLGTARSLCHDARAHHDTNVLELGAKLGFDPVELVRGFNGRLPAHQVGSADLGQKIIDHMLQF